MRSLLRLRRPPPLLIVPRQEEENEEEDEEDEEKEPSSASSSESSGSSDSESDSDSEEEEEDEDENKDEEEDEDNEESEGEEEEEESGQPTIAQSFPNGPTATYIMMAVDPTSTAVLRRRRLSDRRPPPLKLHIRQEQRPSTTASAEPPSPTGSTSSHSPDSPKSPDSPASPSSPKPSASETGARASITAGPTTLSTTTIRSRPVETSEVLAIDTAVWTAPAVTETLFEPVQTGRVAGAREPNVVVMNNGGHIALTVVAAAGGLAGIILLYILFRKRRRNKTKQQEELPGEEQEKRKVAGGVMKWLSTLDVRSNRGSQQPRPITKSTNTDPLYAADRNERPETVSTRPSMLKPVAMPMQAFVLPSPSANPFDDPQREKSYDMLNNRPRSTTLTHTGDWLRNPFENPKDRRFDPFGDYADRKG